ncbi:glycosyltransferase [Pseudochryseolinea flava]|uniref:Glycosyl transferase family 1 domain-containing protein n=1 Tax=Pseudochryseolinea flava TaxID=2059302 RepID=A0A364Y1U9_9BACT|nr:glycosyltransferase [Pseudochryseolinea flava]RAV99755.1 hypothetical protein DQQ10_17055 [Pseudochryseolinea flava]
MPALQTKRIVFSGINISKGGPLTVLRFFYDYAARALPDYELIFILQDKNLLPIGRHRVIEIKNGQRSIFHKLYFEYFGFRRLSRELNADLWLSLNDMSPCVSARVQAAYFHNAAPFYKLKWLDLLFPARLVPQKFYYYFIYRINIFNNDFVVVQQQFLKEYVGKSIGFPAERILINRPETVQEKVVRVKQDRHGPVIFFCTTKPEVYKNIHLIADAVGLLKAWGIQNFVVKMTISGDETRYSRYIKKKVENYTEIEFVGSQSYDVLQTMVGASDCVLFPSLLESWGLPLSEAAALGKLIIAADLPYAYETLWGYENVVFVSPYHAEALASEMKKVIENRPVVDVSSELKHFPGNFTVEQLFYKMLSSK